jgi:cystathionine beta-lyase/cystathionine gamma-synthase
MLKAGDHIILSENVYGGTFRLINGVLKHFALDVSFIDTSSTANIEAAWTDATRMVFVETPTNPMLTLTDIRAASKLCKQKNAELVVDNTFMSPALQSPLELGADMVVHSTTKFINGHSDSVGGAVVVNKPEHADRLLFIQKSAGAVLSPFDSWLVLRGVKTLGVRVERHEASSRKIASFLDEHPKVTHVLYPGLESHPQHALAKEQARGFGALISFDLGSYANAKIFLDSLKVCTLAESLGGVETLISHPGSMTHASVPPEEQARLGITEGMVRISVGIEDAEDLIADLDQGLSRIG